MLAKISRFLSFNFIVLIILSAVFTGCGGGGGSSSSNNTTVTKTGYLKDSAIQGVNYTSGSLNGTTDVNGVFQYEENTTVTFTIGGVTLGVINSSNIQSDNIVYPSDILGINRTEIEKNLTDPRLIKMLRFLQSLDSDNNPSNGIIIESNTITTLQGSTLDLSSDTITNEEMENIVTSLGRTLVSEADAVTHFRSTLATDKVLNNPIANSVTVNTDEDTPVTFTSDNFVNKFIDNDTLVKIKVSQLPINGTLNLKNIKVSLEDEIILSELNNLTYTPNENYNGEDSFKGYGYNGKTYSNEATMKIIISSVNDPVTIEGNPTTSINQGETYNFKCSAEDVDKNDSFTYSISNKPNFLEFNTTNCILNGDIGDNDLGTYNNITITVSDGTTNDSLSFNLTVNEALSYSWQSSSWSSCSGSCGVDNGIQTRTVSCISSTGQTVNDSFCTDTKPTVSNSCTASLCNNNTAPTITSNNTANTAENQTTVLTVTATDPENDTVTFSLTGGADQALFSIDGNSGALTFQNAPDFETPLDANTDNDYIVEVTATDDGAGNLTDSQTITVTVTDVNEVQSISHDGFTYNIITSPITGKQWLDRNLGASAVCTESRDSGSFASDAEYVTSQESCFGDLYQWGRLTDGHEKRDSGTIGTRATDITSAGVQFITNGDSPYDWVENTTQDGNNVDDDGALRTAQWSKTDGTSICPIGFRVPTSIELYNETTDYVGADDEGTGAVKIVNRDTAYKNFLRFPIAGGRTYDGSFLYVQGGNGTVWSSSTGGSSAEYLNISSGYASESSYSRAYGFSVRCVKD